MKWTKRLLFLAAVAVLACGCTEAHVRAGLLDDLQATLGQAERSKELLSSSTQVPRQARQQTSSDEIDVCDTSAPAGHRPRSADTVPTGDGADRPLRTDEQAFLAAVMKRFVDDANVRLAPPQVAEDPDGVDVVVRELPRLPQPDQQVIEPQAVHVAWTDPWNSAFDSEITVTADGRASVVTYDDRGHLAVAYDGVAYVSAAGALVIDARGASMTGPRSHAWEPDSFVIKDGVVSMVDDAMRQSRGQGVNSENN